MEGELEMLNCIELYKKSWFLLTNKNNCVWFTYIFELCQIQLCYLVTLVFGIQQILKQKKAYHLSTAACLNIKELEFFNLWGCILFRVEREDSIYGGFKQTATISVETYCSCDAAGEPTCAEFGNVAACGISTGL